MTDEAEECRLREEFWRARVHRLEGVLRDTLDSLDRMRHLQVPVSSAVQYDGLVARLRDELAIQGRVG